MKEETGRYASRNRLQTNTLLDAIEEFKFDACIGGARRDEEKARAKERIFSVRDDFGQWDEKNQRPEVFDMLNGNIDLGQNVRVFPISNWTELDVWSYIEKENIEIPSIYFAHKRKIFVRDGMIWSADDEVVFRDEDEEVLEKMVRFRTVGDMSCTAAVLSDAIILQKLSKKLEILQFQNEVQELMTNVLKQQWKNVNNKGISRYCRYCLLSL